MPELDVSSLILALQLMQSNPAAFKALAESPQFKHTQPSGTPSTPYYTGPGGLFNTGGGTLERDVFSTRVALRGILGQIPWRATTDQTPLYPYLTGFRAGSGSNPSTSCGACKTPGPAKSCFQTAKFAHLCRDTRELDITRVGQTNDRGDTFDLRLINDPLGGDLAKVLWPGLPQSQALVNGREMLARMIEVGVDLTNELCPMVYAGNPANDSGDYQEFPGLDILIGTGKVDALTNTACPSLDSLVRNWNYAKIDAANTDIVNEIQYITHWLEHNADRMGYDPVTWVIVMREELYYELTRIWPCTYFTTGCSHTLNSGVLSVDAGDQIALRDAMRAKHVLTIDGKDWPVVFDDCIAEYSSGDSNKISATCFSSDIYFLPITVQGGVVVTYMEHYDWTGSLQAAMDAHYDGVFWSDSGRYLWARLPNVATCIQLKVKLWPRLRLAAPFLAARLRNVQYCPLIHTRQPLPTDDYFTNGGVYTPRAAPSYYREWA